MEEEEEQRPNFVCLILDWRVPASPDGRAGLRDGLPSSSSTQEQFGMPPKQEGTKTEERCSSSLPCRSPGGLVLKKLSGLIGPSQAQKLRWVLWKEGGQWAGRRRGGEGIASPNLG